MCRVAGTGEAGFNGDGLDALESWLYLPSAVARAPDRRLVLVDFNNNFLRAIEEDGRLTTIAGNGVHAYSTPGTSILDSPLENPVDVLWEPDGSMLISMSHEARVIRVASDGVVTLAAGTGEEGYSGDGGPATEATFSAYLGGIALGEDGTLFIADTPNNVVRAVAPDGIITTLPLVTTGPQGLAIGDGGLYVASSLDGEIRRYDLDSGDTSTAAAGLSNPWGVAWHEGALYVANSGANEVLRVVGADTEVLAGTGEAGLDGDGGSAVDATFAWPADVFVDDGVLYVADMRNHVIRAVGL